MLSINDLKEQFEIQSEIHYCYYDDKKEERVEILEEIANNKEIKYMYCEDNEIYIEVEYE